MGFSLWPSLWVLDSLEPALAPRTHPRPKAGDSARKTHTKNTIGPPTFFSKGSVFFGTEKPMLPYIKKGRGERGAHTIFLYGPYVFLVGVFRVFCT